MGFFKQLVKVVFGSANDNRKATAPTSNIQPKAFVINQSNQQQVWGENKDLIKGMQFFATMQLRTPLRVLKRHGEIHSDSNTDPPKIAKELWEGIWVPHLRTWRELGLNVDEAKSTMASTIGQIQPSDYLPFLISVRMIVESYETIDSRISQMRDNLITGSLKAYVVKHGGIDKIIDEFFPRFIDTIPKATHTIIDGLSKLEIVTAYGIESATDETLMSIKGIGAAKLKSIRDYCAGITENRHATRLDRVTR